MNNALVSSLPNVGDISETKSPKLLLPSQIQVVNCMLIIAVSKLLDRALQMAAKIDLMEFMIHQ